MNRKPGISAEAYWCAWAEQRANRIIELERLNLALADRIHAAHEILAHKAEKRPVRITETDYAYEG